MTRRGTGCGNDPRTVLTPGDQEAVEEFKAYLAARKNGDAPPAPVEEYHFQTSHNGGNWQNSGAPYETLNEARERLADCRLAKAQWRLRIVRASTSYEVVV